MRLQEINHAIKLTIEQAGSKDERIKILFTAERTRIKDIIRYTVRIMLTLYSADIQFNSFAL